MNVSLGNTTDWCQFLCENITSHASCEILVTDRLIYRQNFVLLIPVIAVPIISAIALMVLGIRCYRRCQNKSGEAI